MFRNTLAGIFLLCLSVPSGVSVGCDYGEGVKCYHCYDFTNSTIALGGTESYGTLVPCDKNQSKWNSWDCPPQFSMCMLISVSIPKYTERVRTCAVLGYCSRYIPPPGVTMDYCIECNSTLCNGHRPLGFSRDNVETDEEEKSPAVPSN